MNPKGESNIAIIAAVTIVTIILLTMCGCKTKTIVETVVEHVHDTVQIHHSDTVREVKVTHHTDTVMQLETHTYTLNNVGDTVKEIHHYHDLWHTTVIDSTDRYKAVVDSLRKALSEEKAKEVVVVKKDSIPWWWKAVFVLAMFILCVIVLIYGKRKFIDRL